MKNNKHMYWRKFVHADCIGIIRKPYVPVSAMKATTIQVIKALNSNSTQISIPGDVYIEATELIERLRK